MKCPICHTKIGFSEDSATCEKDHLFPMKNDVYQLLAPEFKERLERYLNAFEDSRKPYVSTLDSTQFKDLPFSSSASPMWKPRQYDVNLIKRLMDDGRGKALEIGAWNGWLTNQLTQFGFETTAIDIFIDTLDGLGAKCHYDNTWLALQMNPNDLSILEPEYDLIVINRSLNYFTDLQGSIEQLKGLLSPKGKLVITGMTYHKNASNTIAQLEAAELEFKEKYDIPFRLSPFKGYLEEQDLSLIESLDVELHIYPELKLKSKRARFFPKKPVYYYGIYVKK